MKPTRNPTKHTACFVLFLLVGFIVFYILFLCVMVVGLLDCCCWVVCRCVV